MKPRTLLFALFALAAFACAPSTTVRETPRAQEPAPAVTRAQNPPLPWIDSVLSVMTLEEKVGQMVMVTVPGLLTSDGSEEDVRLQSLIRDWDVGGVTVTRGDVYAAAVMINRLQRLARFPLLVSADMEHGLSMRFYRGTNFPDAMALGATRDPELAYEEGRITGEEARALGITMNLAPVVDVNTNARNPAINTRSFGEDLGLVDTMAGAYIRGTRDAGALATAKHFPGHGSTGEDSHLQLPVLNFTRARLDSLEFAAFKSTVDSGVAAIMVGHMAVPAVDSSGLPASLSEKLVTGVIRGDFKFKGLIITDAMGMAGARVLPPGRAAVTAVKAGVDILLLTEDEQRAIQALRDAVRSGEIAMQRIDESVRRILEAKERVGLHARRSVDLDRISLYVGTPEHWQTARRIAERAVTLLRNDGRLLPLPRRMKKHRVVSLILTDGEDSRTEVDQQGRAALNEPTGASFTRQLHRYRLRAETIRLTPQSTKEEFALALARLKSADLALVSLFVRVRTSSGHIGMPDEYAEFVRQVNALRTPMVLVSFGDPYTVAGWTAPRAVLCAYADAEVMTEAVAKAIFGDRPVTGRLPVSVSPALPAGTGLPLGSFPPAGADTLRAESTPGALGTAVDDLMNRAVHDSVFPGAQLVVIRDNAIILDRCYGRLTYDAGSPPVDDSTIYDLASLTKVCATTPAVMKLCDEGKIGLDDSLSLYLPQFAVGPKRAVTVRNLLLHQGGFPPFRKLWEIASTPTAALDTVLSTPLIVRPGDSTIYSDFSMITLGAVVQHLSGVTLDEYVREKFYAPLGMRLTTFNPRPPLQARAAPTEYDSTWRKRLVSGTVHDENASLLGGVSGHAGLFSTARDLARYVAMLLNDGVYGGREFVSRGTVRQFIGARAPGQERWLGWDMKSPSGSSAGPLFSDDSFGHTGFTGTSIWADPARRLAVILLTNRVYPTRANTRIIRFRPLLHTAVVRALS